MDSSPNLRVPRAPRTTIRILSLAAVLTVASVIYVRDNQRAAVTLSPAEHLRAAEAIHAIIAQSSLAAIHDTIAMRDALRHYQAASLSNDLPTAVRAMFGAGQILILKGDTNGAVGEWAKAATINSDNFSRLRALKAIADAEYDSNRHDDAKAWYKQIVDIYAHDTEMTQQTKVIVAIARNRM